MKYVALLIALFVPVSVAVAATGTTGKPSTTMLLFIFGAVASMLFVKARQNADFHTGIIPIFQSVVIVTCFIWSHYILLVVDEVPLLEFYSNFILHIDKGIAAFLCVIMLYIGFAAVIFRTVKIGIGFLQKPSSPRPKK